MGKPFITQQCAEYDSGQKPENHMNRNYLFHYSNHWSRRPRYNKKTARTGVWAGVKTKILSLRYAKRKTYISYLLFLYGIEAFAINARNG